MEGIMSAQLGRLLAYLEGRGTITTLEAQTELGILRLSERCRELERMGIPIFHEAQMPVLNRFGQTCHVTRYHLLNEERIAYG